MTKFIQKIKCLFGWHTFSCLTFCDGKTSHRFCTKCSFEKIRCVTESEKSFWEHENEQDD